MNNKKLNYLYFKNLKKQINNNSFLIIFHMDFISSPNFQKFLSLSRERNVSILKVKLNLIKEKIFTKKLNIFYNGPTITVLSNNDILETLSFLKNFSFLIGIVIFLKKKLINFFYLTHIVLFYSISLKIKNRRELQIFFFQKLLNFFFSFNISLINYLYLHYLHKILLYANLESNRKKL